MNKLDRTPAEKLTTDINLLDHMTGAELARETGFAEAATLCDESDDDLKYRAELEKRAALATPLLDRAAITTPRTSNAFWRALAALPAAV